MTFPVGAYDALNKKRMQIQRKKFIVNRITFAYRAPASCGGNEYFYDCLAESAFSINKSARIRYFSAGGRGGPMKNSLMRWKQT